MSLPSSNSHFESGGDPVESRKRQSKRDDAIRRRIENDLSKKKRSGVKSTRRRKGAPGSVLLLRPSEPVICKNSSTVYEVSQMMIARRENCVLVVDENGELLGIFTAKDLAFRVVGAGLNANTLTIDQIMTPNPLCANSNAPASEALTLMVQRGFRHLPVLDDDNQIVGILDITKCYSQQMEKLERVHASSKKLYEALDTVHNEIGMAQQPYHVFQYFESLKSKMNGPTLESVLDTATAPVYVSVKANVYDATILMRENNSTAVLVQDQVTSSVSGIFTSKDVVLRVIAAGLDPKKCSVVRVMTPKPDVANITLSLQQALRQMFDGHYLNLPVVNEDSEIVGVVDVLKLTYATLNQIKQIEESDQSAENTSNSPSQQQSTTNEHGPAWNKFWTSLDNDGDSESAHSDSAIGSAPEVSASEFHAFNVEIGPSDSVSHVETNQGNTSLNNTNNSFKNEPSFIFKFRSPALGSRVHRISIRPSEGLSRLHELIDHKLLSKDFEYLKVSPERNDETYAISYVDDEGDIVSITSDNDLSDCIAMYQSLSEERAELYIHNPHEHAPVEENSQARKFNRGSSPAPPTATGISNEVLIAGAIGVLGGAAIIGFILGRK
ncbi:uncharacterized protein KQ657_005257 [Scheffersomyces spartinae]|uniref:CBS-domain-containing protein n=1 Tax=Scheffersomyces spartinae TaxID=45513 RepID=A0A9P8AIQ0_9ASCO|nr:uncharacterized protein KQ657_005257 [Scheffersomyces spartinae]KAG7194054.1 hypothetical protein KQ657_005257 [Scheffersomyces spartinae]